MRSRIAGTGQSGRPTETDRGDVRAWRRRAACRGLASGIFYPASDEEATEAKAVCDGCPVREECLAYALAAREKHGVWGGLTERERARLLRRRHRAA